MKFKIHHPFIILFFYIFWILGKLIPLKILPLFGIALGNLAFFILGSLKKIVFENLRTAFPHWKEEKIKKCIRENFKHYGITFFELFKIKKLVGRVEVEGIEFLEERPCLLITGHIGNWELMAQKLGNLKVPLYAVAKATYISTFNKFLINMRKRGGIESLLRNSTEGKKLLLKALKEKKVLGMLIDQDTKVEGVFVPFFSKLAYTPKGSAEIAIKKKLPVVFGYIIRKRGMKYELKIKKLEILSENVEEVTYQMTREIEKVIKRHPTQWVWIHKRWKTKPTN